MPRRWANAHPKRRVSETVARPTRTAMFATVAALILAWYSGHVSHLSRDQLATYTVILTALINAAWVAVENRLGKAVLRDVPPTKAAVVDKGAGELGLVIGVLLVVILVVVLLRVL